MSRTHLPASFAGFVNLVSVERFNLNFNTNVVVWLLSANESRLAVFDEHRTLLQAVAYRMLGSVADAEDMVQETFLRWQETSAEQIQSPRAFLVTIISRLCINHLKSARVQREQYVGQWLPEPWITEPSVKPVDRVELNESLSMAFLVLMERLSPVERAVFLLREVFDYGYGEISAIVDENEANCRQILRRARQHVTDLRSRFKLSESKHRELLERFVHASGTGDLGQLIDLLEADVVLYADGGGKAFAVPRPVYGATNVARAIAQGGAKFRPREPVASRRVHVNGEPGVVAYRAGTPLYVVAIEPGTERIRSIYFITNPEKLSRIPRLTEE
jgi:RNA polymerase sigma-70 factor (ECF subfamily)